MIKNSECFDRIIIKNLDWLDKCDKWVAENRQKLDMVGRVPFENGVLEIYSDQVGKLDVKSSIIFDRISDDRYQMEVGLSRDGEKPRMLFEAVYNLADKAIEETTLKYYSNNIAKKMASLTIQNDMQDSIINLFLITMAATVYGSNVVKASTKTVRSKHEAKQIRRDRNQPLRLVKTVYVADETCVLPTIKDKVKRAEPDHEVSVRGFLRHYKSGKVVFVKPFTKYKGKGNKQAKTYKV